MSKQLATREDTLTLTEENLKALTEKPFRCLPPSVRSAALALWLDTIELFPTAMQLTPTIALWINRHGLDPADAVRILEEMTHPEARSDFRFAADLKTFMAKRAHDAIRRREADRKRSTRAIDEPRAGAEDIAKLREQIADWTGKP